MRRFMSMACIVLLFSVAVSRKASADSYMPPIGGAGGGQFIGACKLNDLLTGFQLRIIDGPQGNYPAGASFEG